VATRTHAAHIDLVKNQLLNAVIQLLSSDPGSPTEGLVYTNNTNHTLKFYNGTTFVQLGRLDQISAPTAQVNLNSQKIVNLATPTAAGDAASKSYVDGLIAGIKWKDSVRAATTANGALATAYENGDVIDGVTLATGDRILLKNQSTGAENGIYTVNASGAPTRATDFDETAEVQAAAVFVREGTTNADTGWVVTNDAAITIGSTAITFAQFTGGSFTAGAGLTSSGSTVNVIGGATPGSGGNGGGLVVNADDVVIDTNVVVRKFAADIGDNSSTSITVTHNLGTKDVTVAVYDKTTPFTEIYPEIQRNSTNTILAIFNVAPTTNQYRVVVHA
jgi:hypothetical protein